MKIFLMTMLCLLPAQIQAQDKTDSKSTFVSVARDTGGVVVKVGNQLFTRYDHATFNKPILFPVYGPGQIEMTRNFPMKKVLGEADDHPHHKSMWLGHEINGVDFWANKTGVIKTEAIEKVDDKEKSFVARNHWIRKSDQSVVCTEQSTFKFGANADSRWIDVTHTFVASHGPVTFEDTKEGVFAIRTHPALRLKGDKKRGVVATGTATNSNGETGPSIWGKSAAWVDYFGTINGKRVGVAIFDHPSNFRHPTTWHARDYGLIAANPFGLHHFKGAKKGAGAHTLEKGEKLSLRYRVVFHIGDTKTAGIAERFAMFAKE